MYTMHSYAQIIRQDRLCILCIHMLNKLYLIDLWNIYSYAQMIMHDISYIGNIRQPTKFSLFKSYTKFIK